MRAKSVRFGGSIVGTLVMVWAQSTSGAQARARSLVVRGSGTSSGSLSRRTARNARTCRSFLVETTQVARTTTVCNCVSSDGGGGGGAALWVAILRRLPCRVLRVERRGWEEGVGGGGGCGGGLEGSQRPQGAPRRSGEAFNGVVRCSARFGNPKSAGLSTSRCGAPWLTYTYLPSNPRRYHALRNVPCVASAW